MQFRTGLHDIGLYRRNMYFQSLNCVTVLVIEDQKAFDLNRTQTLNRTLRIHCLDGALQFLHEDQRRSGRATVVPSTAGKAINNGEPKALLLG